MGTSWIPNRDADFDVFLNNFADKVAAAPTSYGLVTGDGTAIDAVRDSWVTAWGLANDVNTSTSPVRSAKRARRAEATAVMRAQASVVRANAGVSDALKEGLGIVIPDTNNTNVPPPTTFPLLSLVRGESGIHVLRARDSGTPQSNAKPVGATGLRLYQGIGVAPITDPTQATFIDIVTSNPIVVPLDAANDGKKCTYFARWTTARGLVGPWSGPLAYTAAF